MKCNWHKVGHDITRPNEPLEIIGFHTLCCELDAEPEISIKEGYYSEGSGLNFRTEDGYFILPLFYRYLNE